jgi:DtxR family Mn-dependent transcriptional regulator
MMGQAVEDYLKATLELSETQRRASTSALADHLGVKPSSVTAMVKRLSRERPRLVDYKSHQGVRLTEAGKRIALDVVRRHRLIEQFLVTALEYGWDEVHDEAHRLEHCVSPVFVDRIDRFLDHPDFDPHGRPIPHKDGRMSSLRERPLSEVQAGEVVRVSSVRSEDTEFLRYLARIGLSLNASVKVLEAPSVGGVMRVEVGSEGEDHVIGEAIAEDIFVSHMG